MPAKSGDLAEAGRILLQIHQRCKAEKEKAPSQEPSPVAPRSGREETDHVSAIQKGRVM